MIEKINITDSSIINSILNSLPVATAASKGLLNDVGYNQVVRTKPKNIYAEPGVIIKILEMVDQSNFSGILTAGRIEGTVMAPISLSCTTTTKKNVTIVANKMCQLEGGFPGIIYYKNDNGTLTVYLKMNLDYTEFVLHTLHSRGNVSYLEERVDGLPDGAQAVTVA